MKKLFAIAAALLLTVCAFAQDGKSFYQKYSDYPNVSAVYISPAMFRLIGKLPEIDLGTGEVNVSSIVKSLNGFYLIDSENADINDKIKKDADKLVSGGKYELLLEAKDDGDIVHIYTVGDDNVINNLVMIASEPNEITCICLDGKILREDLEKLVAAAME